jgi:hypothetical protein
MRSSDDTKLNWMTQWICYTISMKINFKIALYSNMKIRFQGLKMFYLSSLTAIVQYNSFLMFATSKGLEKITLMTYDKIFHNHSGSRWYFIKQLCSITRRLAWVHIYSQFKFLL